MDKLDVEEALKLTDGGPAFARAASSNDVDEPGMSLLDWFAGQALAGLVVNRSEERPCADYARHAYDCADAMLAERERRNTQEVERLRAHYVAGREIGLGTPPPLFQECAGCTLLRLRVWELERLLGLGAQSASSTSYEVLDGKRD